MSASPTLRSLSGMPAQAAPLSASVLVLIDCQNTYREGVMQLDGVEPALAEAAQLLHRARAAGIPILHVQHDGGPGSDYDITAPIGAIAEVVAPQAGEAVIVKQYPNAFIGTDLEARIAETGRQDVVLVGFMTHMCINSSARGAFNLGLRPTVVASATATRSLPGPDGSALTAQQLHVAALAAVGDLFAVVVPTAQDLPD